MSHNVQGHGDFQSQINPRSQMQNALTEQSIVETPICRIHQQKIEYLCIAQNRPLCVLCVQEISQNEQRQTQVPLNANNIVPLQRGLIVIEQQMQNSVDEMHKTQVRIIQERQISNCPEQNLQALAQKTMQFEEALSSMVRVLNFYRSLSHLEKVKDMEMYLQSFGSHLWEASQAQLYLDELFNSLDSFQQMQMHDQMNQQVLLQSQQKQYLLSSNLDKKQQLTQPAFQSSGHDADSQIRLALQMQTSNNKPQSGQITDSKASNLALKKPMVRLPNPVASSTTSCGQVQNIQKQLPMLNLTQMKAGTGMPLTNQQASLSHGMRNMESDRQVQANSQSLTHKEVRVQDTMNSADGYNQQSLNNRQVQQNNNSSFSNMNQSQPNIINQAPENPANNLNLVKTQGHAQQLEACEVIQYSQNLYNSNICPPQNLPQNQQQVNNFVQNTYNPELSQPNASKVEGLVSLDQATIQQPNETVQQVQVQTAQNQHQAKEYHQNQNTINNNQQQNFMQHPNQNNNGVANPNQGFQSFNGMMGQPGGEMPNLPGHPQHMMGPGSNMAPMMGGGGIQNAGQSLDPDNAVDPKRTYRKKKTWNLCLHITIETPELDHKLNESFDIEIGSNQRLKILMQVILSHVQNLELRKLVQKEKMYIYIEGKEPVARKSKSLAEMGVKDNDNLIVTTEMKLPFDALSDDPEDPFANDGQGGLMFPDQAPVNIAYDVSGGMPADQMNQNNQMDFNKPGSFTPPNLRADNHVPHIESMNNANQPVAMNNPGMINQNYHAQNSIPNMGMANPELINNQKPLSQHMQANAPMINGGGQENVNIPGMYQNRPVGIKQPPSGMKDMKAKSKSPGRKQTPLEGKKAREAGAKSSTVRKPKVVEQIKMQFIQLYFRSSDLVKPEDIQNKEEPVPVDANIDVQAENQAEKAQDDAEQQINSNEQEEQAPEEVMNEDGEKQEESIEWEDEQHEKIEKEEDQDEERSASFEPYDPKNIVEIDVKTSAKVRGLKKYVLDKINMFKKAQILLYKKDEQDPNAQWLELTEADLDQPVKCFQQKIIAFKCYASVQASVEGKGQGYICNLNIDPMDEFERTMKKKTHFWSQIMTRGTTKAMVVIYHRGPGADDEPAGVHPMHYNHTFKDLQISDKDQIKIVEMKKDFQRDYDGESAEEELEEYEEGEDEQDEDNGEEDKPEEEQAVVEQVNECKQEESKPNQEAAQIVQDNGEKRAHEVLFGFESEKE